MQAEGEEGRMDTAETHPPRVGAGADIQPSEPSGARRGLWEQMVLEEHRHAASMVGMRVGDWEAQQQLQEALLASADTLLPAPVDTMVEQSLEEKTQEWSKQQEEVDSEEGEKDGDEDLMLSMHGGVDFVENPNAPPEDLIMQFELPVEVMHRVMTFLDPDSIGYTAMVSPSWSIRPDEAVYRMLCERVFPLQTKKKLMRIERWPSWKHMFLHRPRVRTNGLYVLRTWYLKRPHLDMWSQLPPGTQLEVVYYRYFKFYDDGTVLYSLNHTPVDQMLRVLTTVELEGDAPITMTDQPAAAAAQAQSTQQHRHAGGRQARNAPSSNSGRHGAHAVGSTSGSQIFIGRYEITQRVVTVTVHTHYARIGFELELVHGANGHFSVLKLLSHTSTSLSDPRSQPIPHRVPTDLFYFKRDWETYRAIAREKRGIR